MVMIPLTKYFIKSIRACTIVIIEDTDEKMIASMLDLIKHWRLFFKNDGGKFRWQQLMTL